MGDGGFIKNPEWAKRFLTDGETNEIHAEFYEQQRQRKEHEKQFETAEARKQHLISEHASTQQEAVKMHALRRQLTEVNCKRVYQLEGTQKAKMFPKAEPKPPPEKDQIVTLMQNVYQAGRTSNIVGRKIAATLREQQMLDLMPRNGSMGISKPLCLSSCPLVAADIPGNRRLEAIQLAAAEACRAGGSSSSRPAPSGRLSARESKKFTSLAKFLQGDTQLAAQYGFSEKKMKASLARLKADPKLQTCLKTIKRRANSLNGTRR